jgi:hypothetical protein
VIAALTLSAHALEIANACASMAEPNRFAIIRPTELTRVNRANVIDQCGCTSADPAIGNCKVCTGAGGGFRVSFNRMANDQSVRKSFL